MNSNSRKRMSEHVLAFLPRSSYRRILPLLIALAACLALTACDPNGDDDDDDEFFNSARVVDLAVQDSTIRVGEGTVIAVNFSFDRGRVFQDGDSVIVVVRLPEGIEYREGTAEIDANGSEDEGVGAQVVRCSIRGESFLIFDMDEFDLDNASDPSGDGDAVLTLTIDAVDPVDFATIEAAANGEESPLFSCGQSFSSDADVSISVDR